MSKRSSASVLGLVLCLSSLGSAQSTIGPFVRGGQYSTIQQFDAKVLDWLLANGPGPKEVSLPSQADDPRIVSLRAAATARGVSISDRVPGTCVKDVKQCLRATEAELSVHPVRPSAADGFSATYVLTKRIKGAYAEFSATIIRVRFIRSAHGITIEEVIGSTTPL